MGLDAAKQAVRERVWERLEAAGVSPDGAVGKIPTYVGADRAAQRLAELPEWERARVIKANPDDAQLDIRTRALQDAKLLYMAVPRMASKQPFFRLDPAELGVPPEQAASKDSAAQLARRVGVGEMGLIDLVICGSVAVNRAGARLGKGAGYSDLEVALLIEAGLVTDRTVIVAPVHPLQVLDDDIPVAPHDFHVDLIVTPDEVIRCQRVLRPKGIDWERLPADKIAAIPVLSDGKVRYVNGLAAPSRGG